MDTLSKLQLPQHCDAYSQFTAILKDIQTHYSHLNPIKGAGSRLIEEKYGYSTPRGNQAIQEYIKGGFVTIMASWEAYINDILDEALRLLDAIGEGELVRLKRKWPHCQTLIQEAFIARTDSDPKRMAARAFDHMVDRDSWRILLEERCKQLLSKMKPFFQGDDGIDATFRLLFSPKKSKSGNGQQQVPPKKVASGDGQQQVPPKKVALGDGQQQVPPKKVASGDGQQQVPPKKVASGDGQQQVPPKKVASGDGQYSLSVTMASFPCAYQHFHNPRRQQDSQQHNGDPEINVSLAGEPATLRAILNLYYGVRCVLAHGKSEKTFTSGALKDFNPSELKVPEEAKEQLCDLFMRIKSDRSRAQIDYHTLLNAERFLWRMARAMMLAIAEYFHNEFDVIIWGFDPQRKCKPSSIGPTEYLNRRQY